MYLYILVYVIVSGVWIGTAIDEFTKRHYYRFGIAAMLALSAAVLMIKAAFA